ncbi:hypothetical protein LCGC14_1526530 [marine sediment metagenome]|uniref:Cxxc_20_cxxc protein n=1 Tax=marine sediment metagenome TaxID=412755 RepID=A0A0F9JI03_9ZZZZ
MSICPNCTKNIKPFSLSFSVFPLYFKCADCNVRLKLVSSKLFWITFLLYLLLIVVLLTYIPFFTEYNIGVIVAITGWFAVYYKITPTLFNKDNLELYR